MNAAPILFDEAVRRARAGEDMEYAPVTLEGLVLNHRLAIVFGTYDGAPGGYVFYPVTGAGDNITYVNQGFSPQDVLRARLSGMMQLEATTEIVTGLFRSAEAPSPPASWFQPQGRSVDGLWYVRDPVQFGADAGLETVPYYIDQFAVDGRDWPKGGTTRLSFNNRHMEYALTWFGLAATLFGVWGAFSLQKRD